MSVLTWLSLKILYPLLFTSKLTITKNNEVEELVESLINSKPNGVKIVEMEQTLSQSRLRLGYITQKLVEEGKVIKIENKYYPKGKNGLNPSK